MVECIRNNLISSGINSHEGIPINRITRAIHQTTADDLNNHGFIINGTNETITVKVYNHDDVFLNSDWFQWFAIKAHIVEIQPNWFALVHSGFSLRNDYKDMLVKVNSNPDRLSVRKRFLYVWNGILLQEYDITAIESHGANTTNRSRKSRVYCLLCVIVIICTTVILVVLLLTLRDLLQ